MIAELVCQAIGLPEWAPRVLRRTAAVLLVSVFVVDRAAFVHGFQMWIAHEQHQVMQTLDPVLTAMSPTPAS